MKQILKIAMIMLAATTLWGCYEEPQPLDKPFVYIMDEAGGGKMDISAKANNFLSEMYVYLSSKKVDVDTVVEYEVIVGDGLKEGVDFVIQSTTKSPITFKPGTYGPMPIRVSWKKTENLDPTKDNTVTFRLTNCSRSDVYIGYLGPDRLHSEYVFTKK